MFLQTQAGTQKSKTGFYSADVPRFRRRLGCQLLTLLYRFIILGKPQIQKDKGSKNKLRRTAYNQCVPTERSPQAKMSSRKKIISKRIYGRAPSNWRAFPPQKTSTSKYLPNNTSLAETLYSSN